MIHVKILRRTGDGLFASHSLLICDCVFPASISDALRYFAGMRIVVRGADGHVAAI
jgi:hypothetical protein